VQTLFEFIVAESVVCGMPRGSGDLLLLRTPRSVVMQVMIHFDPSCVMYGYEDRATVSEGSAIGRLPVPARDMDVVKWHCMCCYDQCCAFAERS
jgi:hypothetical protein